MAFRSSSLILVFLFLGFEAKASIYEPIPTLHDDSAFFLFGIRSDLWSSQYYVSSALALRYRF